jgi:antitoxin component of RelBE/YafQ-DinJ toxin-antitoxin module
MTVTLEIDEKVVERARELAEEYGISLETMLGEYVRGLALDKMTPTELARELRRQWATSCGDSRGEKWTREEIHERGGVR